MATKYTLKYRPVTGKKPGTEEVIVRPQITECETLYINQIVEQALAGSYIRGKEEDCKGIVNGFFQCLQALILSGKAVNLSNWIRIAPFLTGTLDADNNNQLTDANELRVRVTSLADLKASKDDFSWVNVEDTAAKIKFESISSPGGDKGVILKTKDIVITGKNMVFNSTWGDTLTVTYEGLENPISLTPAEQSEAYFRISWPSALAEVEVGTVLTFTGTLHGVEGGDAQVRTISGVLRAA